MKLQTKILIPVVGLIVLLTVVLSAVYYWMIGGNAEEQFFSRGKSVATNLANTGRMGVLMRDSTQLSSCMDATMTDPEVLFVGFFDIGGGSIATRGTPIKSTDLKNPKFTEFEHGSAVLTDKQEVEEFLMPVFARKGDTKPLGYVRAGISMESLSSDKRATLLWSLLLCVIFSFSAVVAVVVIMRILRPLIDGIRLVSSGDLSVELKNTTNDEVGELISNLGRFIENIRVSIQDVKAEAMNVKHHAEEILKDSQSIAANAEDGSRRVAEAASAVQEMASTIGENSKNAITTSDTSKHAKKAAEQGGTVVEETVNSMKSIAEVV